MKRSGHVVSKIGLWGNLPGYTFMQNLKLKQVYIGSNFDNIYFHAKSLVKSRKYHKIKSYTLLKSYDHAEFKPGACFIYLLIVKPTKINNIWGGS